MKGFRNSSRNGQVWRYQRAGGRAVILEVSGRWMEAAEAWRRAACIAPRTDWQQFARKRAEHCHRRCRGRV
ncbi:ANR family transcriptional regulator [Escherichia coli]|uniref:ANR family transcriptional regulator n=1 Tax=Escherichia coli TaxID=562 RepID=UPI000CFAE19F|nr:ANR family transcriptional regulator [Escherichia coli]